AAKVNSSFSGAAYRALSRVVESDLEARHFAHPSPGFEGLWPAAHEDGAGEAQRGHAGDSTEEAPARSRERWAGNPGASVESEERQQGYPEAMVRVGHGIYG